MLLDIVEARYNQIWQYNKDHNIVGVLNGFEIFKEDLLSGTTATMLATHSAKLDLLRNNSLSFTHLNKL